MTGSHRHASIVDVIGFATRMLHPTKTNGIWDGYRDQDYVNGIWQHKVKMCYQRVEIIGKSGVVFFDTWKVIRLSCGTELAYLSMLAFYWSILLKVDYHVQSCTCMMIQYILQTNFISFVMVRNTQWFDKTHLQGSYQCRFCYKPSRDSGKI